MGIDDMALVHKDVGPDEIFQRERESAAVRRGSLACEELPHLEGSREGDRERAFEEMAREVEGNQERMASQKPKLELLKGQIEGEIMRNSPSFFVDQNQTKLASSYGST